MAINNRLVILVEDDMLAWLHSEHERTAAPVGAIVRRAISKAMGLHRIVEATPVQQVPRPTPLLIARVEEIEQGKES